VAGLKRYEVMVRKNSTATYDYLFSKYKSIMNQLQESSSNKDEDGNYIFIYYADLFDMRNGKNYKIFCDYAVSLFEIEDYFILSDGTKIIGIMDVNPYIEPTSGSVISNQENGTIA
jgi:hypothetical protein